MVCVGLQVSRYYEKSPKSISQKALRHKESDFGESIKISEFCQPVATVGSNSLASVHEV